MKNAEETNFIRDNDRQSDASFSFKDLCCGCTACGLVCPTGAITMETDEEGFFYPYIDPYKCIGCNKCRETCAFSRAVSSCGSVERKQAEPRSPTIYAVQHLDTRIRAASRSGGFFSALSDLVLDSGGVVYGCVLTDELNAVHIRCEGKADRDRMRGSKYVQSDLKACFRVVKADLDAGRLVLFSGTPCQVEGLLSVVGSAEELITMDILCHGVQSPRVLKQYLSWQGKRNHSIVRSIDFRNKRKFGWRDHVETLYFKNGKEVDSRVYTALFYSLLFIRPSCYVCPYRKVHHSADFTVGDFWGIENMAPEFDDNKGTSLVMLNNKKSEELFDRIKDSLFIKQVDLNDTVQASLTKGYKEPPEREAAWHEFDSLSFDRFLSKRLNYGRMNNLVSRIKRFVIIAD